MKRAPSFFFLLGVGLSLAIAGYQVVQVRLGKEDVRRFAEAKASELLKVPVQIGKIRYLPPFRVSIEGIQIGRQSQDSTFSIARIKKLTLGYGILNLVRRDFKIPSSFELGEPEINFRSSHSPLPFLDSVSASAKSVPAKLVIENGEFHYPGGEGQKEFILSQVRFKARLDSNGKIRLNLSSKIRGIASGSFQVKGVTDPQFRHYQLEVEVDEVTFVSGSHIPLRKIGGDFRVSESTIEISALTSFFHNWAVQWKGRVVNWQTQPKISLEVINKKGRSPFQFSTQADFETHQFQAEGSWTGRRYPVQGKIFQEGKRKIRFAHLELFNGYEGRGQIDGSSGDYHFWFYRERRRIQIESNLDRLEFETRFQLDHVSVNHLDWVVLGRARFAPLPGRAQGEGPRFKGSVETDYFIVEYEPLADFRGSFELDSEGVHAMDFKWGGAFHLTGRILFQGGKSREDLILRVDNFPLESIRDFAGRPLPTNLKGALEGKLKLRGDLKRPEVQGYFTIREGTLEKLEFDRAALQFQGFPPYLRLYDSKIFKGRNRLKLLGAIDLSLQNIFHGIQIKGPDSLVIWKGMSIYWKEGESAIEGQKPLGKKMAVDFEVGAGVPASGKKDPEESHVVLGPKLNF